MLVFNTAKQTQSLDVITNANVDSLLYQSAASESGKISPLSFAIYLLK